MVDFLVLVINLEWWSGGDICQLSAGVVELKTDLEAGSFSAKDGQIYTRSCMAQTAKVRHASIQPSEGRYTGSTSRGCCWTRRFACGGRKTLGAPRVVVPNLPGQSWLRELEEEIADDAAISPQRPEAFTPS
ncbi:hypothetical protein CYMTET_39302 [Cymbomonas tetramitiformis]|uniref:Uncharacterized protein n=1 Tax=Cymbomonas tetramitiformis TaxID=36881 RepID=A0AAE0CAC2_9CHLO|nr:hypothetical protein CYMTET_39302 [Cymbomonas tetramitiformis]